MILPYLPVALLLLVTLYSAVVSFRRPPEAANATWLFPSATRRSAQIAVVLCTAAVFLGAAAWLTIDARRSVRYSSKFLIADGYVGWVRVEFEVNGAPPLPIDGGKYLFKVPASGTLQTSTAEQYGRARNHYFYYSEKAVRALPETGWGGGGMIWVYFNGEGAGPQGKKEIRGIFRRNREAV